MKPQHNGRVTPSQTQSSPGGLSLPGKSEIPSMPDGPLPARYSLSINEAEGTKYLWLELENPGGSAHVWMSIDDAEGMAQNMLQAIAQARTGLLIPSMIQDAMRNQGLDSDG